MSSVTFSRNTAALFLAQLLARSVRLFYLAVLTNWLVPEQLALFIYGLAFYLLFGGVAAFGQGPFLAERRGRSGRGWARFVQHSLTVRTLSSLSIVLLGVLFLIYREGWNEPGLVLAILFLTLLPRGHALWLRQVLIADEDARMVPVFEAVWRTTEVVLGLCWLLLDGGLPGLAVVHLLAWCGEAWSIHRFVGRQHPGIGLGGHRRLLCGVVRWSVTPMMSQWLRLAYLQFGVVVLRELAPSIELARYAIAIQFLSAGLMLPAAMATAMRTALSRQRRTGQPANNRLSQSLPWVLVVGGLAAAVANLIGPQPFAWILGEDYLPTGQMVLNLLWILGPLAAMWLIADGLNQLALRATALACIALGVLAHGVLLVLLLQAEWPPLLAVQVSMAAGVLLAKFAGMAALWRAGLLQHAAPLLLSLLALLCSAALFAGGPASTPLASLLAALPLLLWIYYERSKRGNVK